MRKKKPHVIVFWCFYPFSSTSVISVVLITLVGPRLQYRINVFYRSSLIWSASLLPFHLWAKEMITHFYLLSVQTFTRLEAPGKQKPCLFPQNLTFCFHIFGINFYFMFISASYTFLSLMLVTAFIGREQFVFVAGKICFCSIKKDCFVIRARILTLCI